MGTYFGRAFFNFIGATARWCYGNIWRTLCNKKKFTFNEYLNGPKESGYYDDMGHQLNNGIIGIIIFVLIIVPIIQLMFE